MTAPREERALEYIPFGGKLPIKLTVGIVRSIVANKTKSGKEPTDQQIMKFMMLCQARLLNPFEGDAYLVGYDANDGPQFSLITAHQAFLKRAEVHPEYDGMESGVIIDRGGILLEIEGDFHLQGDKVLGGWAVVHFKNRRVPMRRKLRMESFRKPFGVWKTNPEGMIVKCAEADALRSSFPTMLAGMYLAEEMTGQQPEKVERFEPTLGRQSLKGPAPQAAVEGEIIQETPAEDPHGLERETATYDYMEAIAQATTGEATFALEEQAKAHQPPLEPAQIEQVQKAARSKRSLLD